MANPKKFDLENKIEASWYNLLKDEFNKKYFSDLLQKLSIEYSENIIYPPNNLLFRAFEMFPVSDLKVVILG